MSGAAHEGAAVERVRAVCLVISAISGAEGELFSDFAGESDCDAARASQSDLIGAGASRAKDGGPSHESHRLCRWTNSALS
jgi:hypothetical protein